MRGLRVALGLAVAGTASLAAPSTALAEPPHGTYIRIAPPLVAPAGAPSSRIIYLKRCPRTGCPVQFGTVDDSRTQTSSIAPSGGAVIGPFTQSDAVWQAYVQCVQVTYSPFNVTVTDVDPGNVPHFEEIVGGKATDLSPSLSGAGGVAPFDCAEIPNAISYTFDEFGPDSDSLCWTTAQETAHAYGLDHEYLQPDPMTYRGNDLPKRFQDVDSGCGRFMPEPCLCGRATQNSYQMIVSFYGPGAPISPTVSISHPGDGENVQPGFTLVATATSIIKIDHLEIYVDGALAGSVATQPYAFQPANIDVGPHAIEVRAYDVQGTTGSTTETLNMTPPCTQKKGCSTGQVCANGLCYPGPNQSGGLGAMCSNNDQCISGNCANGGDPSMYCVAPCTLGAAATCPHNFACVPDGANAVCYPSPSGGCCDAGGSPRGAFALAAGVLAVALRRRRA